MTYNLRPEIKIKHAAQTWNNYDEIAEELNKQFNDGKKTITLESVSYTHLTLPTKA